jgi:hypothetical protein
MKDISDAYRIEIKGKQEVGGLIRTIRSLKRLFSNNPDINISLKRDDGNYIKVLGIEYAQLEDVTDKVSKKSPFELAITRIDPINQIYDSIVNNSGIPNDNSNNPKLPVGNEEISRVETLDEQTIREFLELDRFNEELEKQNTSLSSELQRLHLELESAYRKVSSGKRSATILEKRTKAPESFYEALLARVSGKIEQTNNILKILEKERLSLYLPNINETIAKINLLGIGNVESKDNLRDLLAKYKFNIHDKLSLDYDAISKKSDKFDDYRCALEDEADFSQLNYRLKKKLTSELNEIKTIIEKYESGRNEFVNSSYDTIKKARAILEEFDKITLSGLKIRQNDKLSLDSIPLMILAYGEQSKYKIDIIIPSNRVDSELGNALLQSKILENKFKEYIGTEIFGNIVSNINSEGGNHLLEHLTISIPESYNLTQVNNLVEIINKSVIESHSGTIFNHLGMGLEIEVRNIIKDVNYDQNKTKTPVGNTPQEFEPEINTEIHNYEIKSRGRLVSPKIQNIRDLVISYLRTANEKNEDAYMTKLEIDSLTPDDISQQDTYIALRHFRSLGTIETTKLDNRTLKYRLKSEQSDIQPYDERTPIITRQKSMHYGDKKQRYQLLISLINESDEPVHISELKEAMSSIYESNMTEPKIQEDLRYLRRLGVIRISDKSKARNTRYEVSSWHLNRIAVNQAQEKIEELMSKNPGIPYSLNELETNIRDKIDVPLHESNIQFVKEKMRKKFNESFVTNFAGRNSTYMLKG